MLACRVGAPLPVRKTTQSFGMGYCAIAVYNAGCALDVARTLAAKSS